MKAHAKKAFVIVCGTAAAVLIAATLSVTVSIPANATAGFAAQTSKPCGFCHQNPAGGGAQPHPAPVHHARPSPRAGSPSKGLPGRQRGGQIVVFHRKHSADKVHINEKPG